MLLRLCVVSLMSKKNDDIEIPKDLGVKFGSVEEKAWTEILHDAEQRILVLDREREINLVVIDLAKAKIALEKEKFK